MELRQELSEFLVISDEELFFFDQIEELFLELDIGRTGEQKSKDLATSAVRRIREQIG